ncbi:MAG: hypothetical protein QOF85_1373 [Solirubrobacterales bacterium]|jgi:hypothetical protein|nr:hypothetical protein [Solirubrobacterales bacterium]
MTIGTSLFLIAVGAILKWAVTAHVAGINVHVAGLVLMIVGAIGLVLGLFLLLRAPTLPEQPPGRV